MKVKQSIALAALLVLPFAAIAQSSQQANPLAENASVPASTYVSAFKNYQTAIDSQASPDQGWRATNEEVGKLGGHAGHISGSAKVAATAEQSSFVDKPSIPSQMTPVQTDHRAHRHH